MATEIEILTQAAEQGDVEAMSKLGEKYYADYCRHDIIQDGQIAVHWYTKAADSGNLSAMFNLSNMSHLLIDVRKANYWLFKVAELGHKGAQCNLGDFYQKGDQYRGIQEDLKTANYWYTKSAEQGERWAQFYLGRNYANGKGITKDLEKAKYWINLSAEQGNEDAQKALAKLNAGATSIREGCYVATCVYGSYDCPEVWTFREFRDNTLRNSWLGRQFISIYYATSPKVVELFGENKLFKKVCKSILDKILVRLTKEE